MVYQDQLWVDNDPLTPLSAARLNHMEAGILAAHAIAGSSAVPRMGRLLVASSELPQSVKDGCDYVCDGTNDQVEINQALLRASRPGDGFGGEGFIGVELVGPTFYVGHDNATSITTYPSTALFGNGNGTLISPQFTTVGIDRGAIETLNTNVHRILIANLTIGRKTSVSFPGHGIKIVGGGVGDAYEIKSGNDPFHMIHHVNVHRASGKGIWCTGAGGGSREMQIGWCVLFNCMEQGLLVDGSSDSQISDCRATGGGAFPGFELGGGNTRLSNSKAYYRGNANGSTTSADGFLISSSRCEISSCAAQDCGGYGFNVASSEATLTHALADSNNKGFRIASDGSFIGLRGLSRSGGGFSQNVGIEFSGAPKGMVEGVITLPATGIAHVSGSMAANSYARIVRIGSGAAAAQPETLYSVG